MFRKSPNRDLRRGFTLMEILVAIAVIVVGLVGVVAVFPVALRDVQQNQDISISAELVQSVKAALKAGFANAKFDDQTGNYIVTFVHPGRLPPSRSLSYPGSSPPGSVPDELLDWIELPPAGDETQPPRIFPSYPQRDPLMFYTLAYKAGGTGEEVAALHAYNQSAKDTEGSQDENAFESMKDPYVQYGFNILITPMQNQPNLFMVGIRVCRNPELYTLIGGSGLSDDLRIIKDEFFTVMTVK